MQLNPGGQGKSWLDRIADRISPQPAEPESPKPPKVDQTEWEKSVAAHKVNELTVHDIGLIVFNEMQAYTDHDSANDTIAGAREKVAHTLINADDQFGMKRNRLAPSASPIEPSSKALQNHGTRAAYESSLSAARNAYLSPDDPTHGATNFSFRTTPDRSNLKFKHGSPEGLPLKTQSGPFNNSYLKGDVPSRHVWVDTYGQ